MLFYNSKNVYFLLIQFSLIVFTLLFKWTIFLNSTESKSSYCFHCRIIFSIGNLTLTLGFNPIPNKADSFIN